MATVFTLSITCENEAFGETVGERRAEIFRILDDVKERLLYRGEGPLRDINGNRVGSYAFTEADDAADKIRDAAPEMLAALRAIMREDSAAAVDMTDYRSHPDFNALRLAVRAARNVVASVEV